ncbi:MFS transporter [Streptomyces sp. NPDC048179]|uniref:MFS transporter n=1 Tax=Streptomyces sp. NPDC048179 TaxID=3365506 RepID=UPI003715FE4D
MIRRLVTTTVVFGALETALGLMPGYGTFAALLVPTGFAAVTVTTTANAFTQLHGAPHLRGRVMSVYFLVLLGGTPVGAPLTGLVSDAFGARAALVLAGVVSAVAALVLPAVLKGRARRSVRAASVPAGPWPVRTRTGR